MMGNLYFTKVDASSVSMNVFDFVSFKFILESAQKEKIIGIKL